MSISAALLFNTVSWLPWPIPWPFLLASISTVFWFWWVPPYDTMIHFLKFNKAWTYTVKCDIAANYTTNGASYTQLFHNSTLIHQANWQYGVWIYPITYDITVSSWEDLIWYISSFFDPYWWLSMWTIRNIKIYTDIDHPWAITTYYT